MCKDRTTAIASRRHHRERRRGMTRALLALAASGAMLALTGAAAQASWSPVAPSAGYHCGVTASAPHARPLSIQSCVLVHDSPSGAYVQGAVKVSNLSDDRRLRVLPTGYNRVWLQGRPYRNDNCGATTIAGGQTVWCYGKTTLILGHNRDVSATGYVWFGAGTHDGVNSAHWKIARSTPIQDARARIVTILKREAANPAHNREIGAANCNFYSGALKVGSRRGCPTGYLKHAWCADFGRWVWREARVATTYLTASAKSFETYGENLHSWHGGQSLTGIQPGDALVFTRSGDSGHVAFVVAVNRDRSVTTIAGNSGDRVRASIYRPGNRNLLGFTSPVL